MAKTVPLQKLGSALTDMVGDITEEVKEAERRAIRKAAVKVFSSIIKMTPVDTGRARSNWFIDARPNGKTTKTTNADRSASYVSREVTRALEAGGNVFLFNNLPYINKLEFGGYPKNVTRGTRLKNGNYEIRSENGFSKQAPKGMVRVSLARWDSLLQKYFDQEMAKL